MTKNTTIPLIAITKKPSQHFFGYYDKSPWSTNEKYILAMEVPFINYFPKTEPANICLIERTNDNKLNVLAQTYAWNWQQGAMLQWLSSSFDRFIMYNDRINKKFVSILFDIKTGNKTIFPRPIASMSHSGKYALSINFSRLYDTRKDYGYSGIPDLWCNEFHPATDGIYLMNLITRKYHLIISLDQMANFDPKTTLSGVKHWVNHLMFNPHDTRFCFLHRFEIPKMNRFGTRLFTADLNGSNIRCLWSGHVSHFDWLDDTHILVWAVKQRQSTQSGNAKLMSLRLLKQFPWFYERLKTIPFMRTRIYGGGFFLFADQDNAQYHYQQIGEGILTEDGHCSYSPDRKWILMDTYPDLHNIRKILLYNPEKNLCVNVGNFFSPPQLQGLIRCDLHVRWNHRGTQVCIDSAHQGSRQMYVLDVTSIIQ
jgi:hypothetical protein